VPSAAVADTDFRWEHRVVTPFATLWRAILGRPRPELVETQVSGVKQQVVEAFAYQQADLLRDQKVTEEQALGAIAERFPEMTPSQVAQALARGMFLSR
jgi:hypothetical protein